MKGQAGGKEKENVSGRQMDRQTAGRQCHLEGELKGAESERGCGEEKIQST